MFSDEDKTGVPGSLAYMDLEVRAVIDEERPVGSDPVEIRELLAFVWLSRPDSLLKRIAWAWRMIWLKPDPYRLH